MALLDEWRDNEPILRPADDTPGWVDPIQWNERIGRLL